MESSPNSSSPLLMFVAHGQRFALPLERVRQALAAVEITPLPGAPAEIRGVIDVRGEIIPVIDIAGPLGSFARVLKPSDHFVVVDAFNGPLALLVETVDGVVEANDVQKMALPVSTSEAGLQRFDGITRIDDSLVLIHDIDRFFSSEQMRELRSALDKVQRTSA